MGLLCDRCGALYANNLHASFFTLFFLLKNMNVDVMSETQVMLNDERRRRRDDQVKKGLFLRECMQT